MLNSDYSVTETVLEVARQVITKPQRINPDQPEKPIGGRGKLKVENLNLFFDTHHILKNVNLNIPSKSITCIIGPSGCGKTTLLKTFNRLLENEDETKIQGKILLDGTNIYDKNSDAMFIRKKMGLLAQRPIPLPISIKDNIALSAR